MGKKKKNVVAVELHYHRVDTGVFYWFPSGFLEEKIEKEPTLRYHTGLVGFTATSHLTIIVLTTITYQCPWCDINHANCDLRQMAVRLIHSVHLLAVSA